MLVTVFGIVTLVRFEQYIKVSIPMLVTPALIMAVFIVSL